MVEVPEHNVEETITLGNPLLSLIRIRDVSAASEEGHEIKCNGDFNCRHCKREWQKQEARKLGPEVYNAILRWHQVEYEREKFEEEEDERELRAEWEEVERRQLWRHETQKLMSEPPDINYKGIIASDQDEIDLLFERKISISQKDVSYIRGAMLT